MKWFLMVLLACVLVGCENSNDTASAVDNHSGPRYHVTGADNVTRGVAEFRPVLAPDYVCITISAYTLQCVHSPANY